MGQFSGKVVLVTGAARGMGATHARRLAGEGAQVIITDILAPEGQALADELGQSALFLRHDVAEAESWQSVLSAAAKFGGGLDGLVNNAGIAQLRSIEETDQLLFERHQRVNELGVFLGIKYSAPSWPHAGGGAIVNVSSLGGMRAGGSDIAYVSSKWAVRGMTKSAAKELGAKGIRVNSIHPGVVATAMLAEVPEDVMVRRLASIPLGRAGTADDISDLVLFLLSERAAYITGAEIVIDGGLGL